MKISSKILCFVLFTAVLFSSLLFANADHVIDDSDKTSYLFVLSAASGSLKGDVLTLNGVPNVIYFSDRPARVAGHYSVEQFLATWDKKDNNFSSDPPDAVLSILDRDQEQNSVVELLSVEHKDGSLNFKIKVLRGNMPESFEAAALFIDPVQETFPGVY